MAYGKGNEALTAKLRAMYGKRLTQQNYRELLRKQNVSEIAAYLKQQISYADSLHDINENSVHRGQLESVIRRQLFDDYTRVMHYVGQQEMKFYGFFLKRMEIDELLSCIRYTLAGHQSEYFFSLPSYFAEHASFDLYAMAKSKTYEELLNILKDTPYLAILKKFDPNAEKNIAIISIENEFNKYYYDFLLKSIEQNFTGTIKENLRNAFGIEIDLENITKIIRLKKYYQAPADYIKSLILPYHFKVKYPELVRMAESPDLESALKVLNETNYNRYFSQYSDEYIERSTQQIIYDYNKKLLNFSTSSFVSVVAYLQLKRIGIQNLISIIEGIRYGLHSSDIGKLLVGTVV
jgi:V/A-type H+-transporting ATPase subunit C